jgi:hypothetical protein
MASSTDIQESAQALFCALANYFGAPNIDIVFNKEKYPTYLEFKSFWNKTYKAATIEKAFATHVKSGKATLKEIEDLLYGVGLKGKKANEWYYSSLQISKQLIKEIDKISKKFNYVKTGNWTNVFWRHGDTEVMDNITKLFKKANDYQKKLEATGGKNIEKPFENINKWSTADIYFASEKAKKEIEELVKESKIDYTKLNSFIGKQISEGILLPLSLKKQPNQVVIKKVNFNRPQEQKEIEKLEFSGFDTWKKWDEKVNIENYTRTLIMYMAKDKSLFSQFRHDPSSENYRCIVQLKISTAFEGGISAGPIKELLNDIDPGFGTNWYKIYSDANKDFKEKKEFLDKELKSRDRKKYDVEREKLSALVTNEVNPPLMEWLEKNQNNANMFVRSLYTLATARSTNSAKYILAK